MPVVASRGLVVITRDRRIRSRPAELRAYWEFGIRSVWLGAKRDMGPRDQVELFLRYEDRLRHEMVKRGPGPWALKLNSGGLRPLILQSPAHESDGDNRDARHN